jgi:hypothetical protein
MLIFEIYFKLIFKCLKISISGERKKTYFFNWFHGLW